ncbi:MAG: hypothetical protein EYC69_03830 [Bacteroidetes bacterium]|nr:MAG: hypothetical protein EYC69_03830 [Bacteroidota bacterium]
MKNSLLFSGLVYGILLMASCTGKTKQNNAAESPEKVEKSTEASALKPFEWLLGNWSNEMKGQMIAEYWTKTNDSLFQGIGFGLKGQDTIFKEMLQIIQIDGEIYYVPTVSGQNDNQPVLFKMIEVGENYFVSENKEHDFPQIIRYKLESPEVLFAVIEGTNQGKETKREFRFRKARLRLMP